MSQKNKTGRKTGNRKKSKGISEKSTGIQRKLPAFLPGKVNIRENKKYKDSVFTKLFGSEDKALELYNALYQKDLPKGTPVEIVTLEDAMFVKRKNDVSFIVDGHFLVFVEHQSTLNENMPLRLLLYVAQEYEKIFGYKIVKGKQVSNPNLYKEKMIRIPRPEFFVLYNGEKDLMEIDETGIPIKVTEKIMRLSDAFLDSGSEDVNTLELCVKAVDIRFVSRHASLYKGEELSLLGEYSYFSDQVETRLENGVEARTAILEAAEYCIKKGILKDFLLTNETEVVSMLLGVYDEEMEKRVLCEEAEERGKAEGAINTLIILNYSKEEIISALQKSLKITKEQAEKYLESYYSNNS